MKHSNSHAESIKLHLQTLGYTVVDPRCERAITKLLAVAREANQLPAVRIPTFREACQNWPLRAMVVQAETTDGNHVARIRIKNTRTEEVSDWKRANNETVQLCLALLLKNAGKPITSVDAWRMDGEMINHRTNQPYMALYAPSLDSLVNAMPHITEKNRDPAEKRGRGVTYRLKATKVEWLENKT